MKHIIALLLENEPGALSRVVALFSARGYNIENLTVAPRGPRCHETSVRHAATNHLADHQA